jgi:excisionase family DNA binding protein
MEMSELQDRLTLSAVAKLLRVHVGTVHRWVIRGVGGRKLRTVRIGGRRSVMPADLQEFLRCDSVLPAGHQPSPEPPPRTQQASLKILQRHGLIDRDSDQI